MLHFTFIHCMSLKPKHSLNHKKCHVSRVHMLPNQKSRSCLLKSGSFKEVKGYICYQYDDQVCGSLVRFVLNIFFMKLKCFKNKRKIGYAFDLSRVFFPPLQLAEQDQDLYRNFTMTISERWQQEVAETVFDAINQDTDKLEQKRKQKPRIDDVDLGKFLKMNTMDNKWKIVKYIVNVKYIIWNLCCYNFFSFLVLQFGRRGLLFVLLVSYNYHITLFMVISQN